MARASSLHGLALLSLTIPTSSFVMDRSDSLLESDSFAELIVNETLAEGQCDDLEWKDKYGNTCAVYVRSKWCAPPTFTNKKGHGENWKAGYGDFLNHAETSPLQACCGCGGGCTSEDWQDKWGHTCSVYTSNKFCEKPTPENPDGYGSRWKAAYGTFLNHAETSPLDSCCGCGGGCVSEAWSDKYGNTCSVYKTSQWCTKPTPDNPNGYGSNWRDAYGTFLNHAEKSPLEACCECGGGSLHATTTTTTTTLDEISAEIERIKAGLTNYTWQKERIQIQFGGRRDTRSIRKQGTSASLVLVRPSWAKSYRCDDNRGVCEDCSGIVDCMGPNPDAEQLTPRAFAAESSGGTWTRFGVSLHAECPFNYLQLSVFPSRVQGGTLNVFWNGVEINGTRTEQIFPTNYMHSPITPEYFDSCAGQKSMLALLYPNEGGHGNVASLEFTKSEAQANLDLYALHLYVGEGFVACEDRKVCLPKLGKHGRVGIRIRNSNLLQLQCLRGEPMENKQLQDACDDWTKCLEKGGENTISQLLTLLAAARVGEDETSLIARETNVATAEADDAPGCLHPPNEDVESWDCDCFNVAAAVCDTVRYQPGFTEESCMRALICRHPRTCASWVEASCQDAETQAMLSALEGASLQQTANSSASSTPVSFVSELSADGSVMTKALQQRASATQKRARAQSTSVEDTLMSKTCA
eukprot:TRINITY_DN29321_c0_g1_i1.p1 TRINITY_DN29321_c0_g1~~TRINITY_DN29321_c0_g1_i1.p1  ORF type:complete len:695 (+),score=81.41 TRINITY_DN29321_c0_g1_i1:67-2151(+)